MGKMLKRRLLAIIIFGVVAAFIALLVVGAPKVAINWLSDQWLHLFWAVVFAIIAGVIIHYVYIKVVPKPKISQKTIDRNQRKAVAKLILPNNYEIGITEAETVFGREDFVGAISVDNLLVIGRKHFRIIRGDEESYIEDLNTKNGTKLNGGEIKGLGKKKLKGGDEIRVANVLKVRYIVGLS